MLAFFSVFFWSTGVRVKYCDNITCDNDSAISAMCGFFFYIVCQTLSSVVYPFDSKLPKRYAFQIIVSNSILPGSPSFPALCPSTRLSHLMFNFKTTSEVRVVFGRHDVNKDGTSKGGGSFRVK